MIPTTPDPLRPQPTGDLEKQPVSGASPKPTGRVKPGMDELPMDVLRIFLNLDIDAASKLPATFVNRKFKAAMAADPKAQAAFKKQVISDLNQGNSKLFEWAVMNLRGFSVNSNRADSSGYERVRDSSYTNMLYQLVEHEKLNVIQNLKLSKNNADPNALYNAAAQFGKVKILDWLHAQGYKPDAPDWEKNPFNVLVRNAEEANKPEVLQWLLDKGEVTEVAGNYSMGKSDLVKWLVSNYPKLHYVLITDLVRKNDLETLKTIPPEKLKEHVSLIGKTAAGTGNIPILEWAKTVGLKPDSSLCRSAVDGGQLEAFKWVRAFGSEFEKDLGYWAAQRSDIKMLQSLEDQGFVYNKKDDAILQAIIMSDHEGKLDALQWATEKGFTWPGNARFLAANVSKNMDEESFQWVLANAPEDIH